MKKAPSNLFGDDRSHSTSSPSKPSSSSHMKTSSRGKPNSTEKKKEGIWIGVDEINAMAHSAIINPKAKRRLHQQELMALGAKGPKRGSIPPKIGRGIDAKKTKIAKLQRNSDREAGNYVEKKLNDYWDNKLSKDEYLKKIKGNHSGLSKGNRINTEALVGKYNNGVLTLSKDEIAAVRAKTRK